MAVAVDENGAAIVSDDDEGDLCGHGTACAGIVRSFAPECELWSARVLGEGFTGSGEILLAGLAWAVEQGFRHREHEPVDHQAESSRPKAARSPGRAYFQRTT